MSVAETRFELVISFSELLVSENVFISRLLVGLVTEKCKQIYLLLFCQDIGRFSPDPWHHTRSRFHPSIIAGIRRAFWYQALPLQEPGTSWRTVK